MNTKTSLIASVAFAAALAFGSTAFAQTPNADASTTRAVHYGDLNLSTPNGIHTLYRRIRLAASSGCQQVSAMPVALFISCVRVATDAAVREVNNPSLTALHKGRKQGALVAAR